MIYKKMRQHRVCVMLRRLLLPPQAQQKKEQRKKALGFFKQLCTTAVMAELLQHMQALRYGETDAPLMVYIQNDNIPITFPILERLAAYPSTT